MGESVSPWATIAPPVAAEAVAVYTQSQQKARAMVMEVHQTMREIPWKQASLVSLHPWSLHAQGYLYHDLRINAAPAVNLDTAAFIETASGRRVTFQHHVFSMYAVQMRPQESGEIIASAVLPLALATDFIVQHQGRGLRDEGGLFCYEGNEAPMSDLPARAFIPMQTLKSVADMQPMTFSEAFEAAHARQVGFYLARFEACETAWGSSDKRDRKSITPNDRKIAQCLRTWGIIAKDPDWIVAKRQDSGPPRICPSCGNEPKPGAVKCNNGTCTHIFEPKLAFASGIIDLDTPGAMTALRRLSKKDLIELNIYPAVLPFGEYTAQLKANAIAATKAAKDKTE